MTGFSFESEICIWNEILFTKRGFSLLALLSDTWKPALIKRRLPLLIEFKKYYFASKDSLA